MFQRALVSAKQARGAECDPHRSRRVLFLLVVLALLSLADLYATIAHAGSIGMVELNPIAAPLVGVGSMVGLILYKIGTMSVALAALARIRAYILGECTAWLLVGVMVALTLHWYHYNMEATSVTYDQISHATLSEQARLQLGR